jgi:hypothetical protein
MLKQSFNAIEPQRMSDLAPSQSLPTVRETVSGSLSVSSHQHPILPRVLLSSGWLSAAGTL